MYPKLSYILKVTLLSQIMLQIIKYIYLGDEDVKRLSHDYLSDAISIKIFRIVFNN